jgi:hypothetical protein
MLKYKVFNISLGQAGMNNKILYSIIAVAFVGGLFSAVYAGPMMPTITLAGNTNTLGDSDIDGDLNVDGTITGTLSGATQNVPFQVKGPISSIVCDEAGDIGSGSVNMFIESMENKDFMLTSAIFAYGTNTVNDAADDIRIAGMGLDGVNYGGIRSIDATGTLGAFGAFDILELPLLTQVGTFPDQIVAKGDEEGSFKDIRFTISCFAGPTQDISIDFKRVVVSGWKDPNDTIVLSFVDNNP